MATPNDFYQIVRPVVWRTELAEYPYWGRGSLFILDYRGRWFAVTAKHVLKGSNVNDLTIFPRDEIRSTLPLFRRYDPTSNEDFDTDHRDISMLEIDKTKISGEDAKNIHALNFENSYHSPVEIAEGARLMAIGIPSIDIDYGQGTIRFVRFQCLGTYKGSANYIGCYEMVLNSNQVNKIESESGGTMQLESLDGFSGCPIFVDVNDKPGTFSPRFVGMAYRGTVESGKLFFIGADLFKELLEKTDLT